MTLNLRTLVENWSCVLFKDLYFSMYKKSDMFINSVFSLLTFSGKQRKIFIFSIVFGLFLAATMDYYLVPVRYFILLIVSYFIFIVFIVKYKDVFFLTLFLGSLVLCNIWAYYLIQDDFDFSYFHIYLFILIGYILSKENLLEDFKPYVKIIIIGNLYFLVNEKITGVPLLPFLDERDISLVFYGQGIYGYTKNAAEAIGLSILLFRRDYLFKLLILISVILIGVRSAIVFVALIILIDLVITSSFRINVKKIFLFIFFLITVGVILYFISDLFYFGRLESLFSLGSSTYTSRFYYANLHINCFADTGMLQLLFGSGVYCPSIIKNGAENIHLMFITHIGIIAYTLWILLFVLIIFRKINSAFFVVYPLILYLLIGLGVRWGLEWMGGIILYTYIFNIYFNRKVII